MFATYPMVANATNKRRDYFTRAGAIAAGALVAGCTGDGSGDSDRTTEDGSGGGVNTDSNTTSNTDLQELTLVMAPGKFPDIAMHQINTVTNILADEMEQAGYTLKVNKTFSGGTLFASGQADISAIGPAEVERLTIALQDGRRDDERARKETGDTEYSEDDTETSSVWSRTKRLLGERSW